MWMGAASCECVAWRSALGLASGYLHAHLILQLKVDVTCWRPALDVTSFTEQLEQALLRSMAARV